MLKVEVGVRVKLALKVAGGLWSQLIFDSCSMLHGQTFCAHSLYILKQVGALRCVRMVVVCGKFSKNNDRLSQKMTQICVFNAASSVLLGRKYQNWG